MKSHIGEISGQIWQVLHEKGEMPITALAREIGQPAIMTYQGLGWLARENKVVYRRDGRRTFVSLARSGTE